MRCGTHGGADERGSGDPVCDRPQLGWLSADEVREFENNPLPDGIGKTYLVPTNMDIARDDMLRDDASAPQPRRATLYGPDSRPIASK